MLHITSRNPSLQTPTNKLAISLILADFLMMTKTWLLVVNAFAGGPILGTTGCIAFASLGTQAGLVQIWTITIISLDRANAIHYPIVKSKRFTHIQVLICVGTIWVITSVFSMAPIFGWNQYVSEAYFLGCSFDTWSHEFWDQAYVYTLMVFGYFIPLMIICMSYLKIYWFTRQSRQCVLNHMRQIQSQLLDSGKKDQEHESSFTEATLNGNGPTGHSVLYSDQYAEEFLRKTLEKEKCLARMALFIIGVWIVTWTPYAVIAMLQEHGLGYWISPGISLTALTLAKCSSIVNTFIYGLRLPHFKKHVNQILPWLNSPSQSKSSVKGGMPLDLRKGPPLNSKKRVLKGRRRQEPKIDASVKGDLSNSNSKTTSKTQHVSVSEIRIQQVQKNLEIEQAKFEELCQAIEVRPVDLSSFVVVHLSAVLL
ncbi:hypothetical protein TCAL_09904 [Tigriopus californicus]|uniref:G-protein coupled receptors family 1 profile domain-containing protein n=1 Tax=Tigriopus californicus TaxID=6832 RepID=A0A553PN64_TIGCA|nr:hypothetical protein TCAL_09904 [Tigriopus californicus]|eukprot:TCALIF_09904-PA protein Name:"Similar to SCOP1 Rhodopsin, GQ-coupled (Mizuhopecten yessoensis)" AED:0.31 eAED:0.27 QI:0/0.4/0/0.5/1/1/6/0/424